MLNFFSSAFIMLLTTTGYEGTYLAARTTKEQTYTDNFRFVPMLVCFSGKKFYHRLARSTYKPDFLFSNIGLGVLHSQKCYVMFRWIECYQGSYFSSDQVALYSDFFLILLLVPVFATYSSNAFYILE